MQGRRTHPRDPSPVGWESVRWHKSVLGLRRGSGRRFRRPLTHFRCEWPAPARMDETGRFSPCYWRPFRAGSICGHSWSSRTDRPCRSEPQTADYLPTDPFDPDRILPAPCVRTWTPGIRCRKSGNRWRLWRCLHSDIEAEHTWVANHQRWSQSLRCPGASRLAVSNHRSQMVPPRTHPRRYRTKRSSIRGSTWWRPLFHLWRSAAALHRRWQPAALCSSSAMYHFKHNGKMSCLSLFHSEQEIYKEIYKEVYKEILKQREKERRKDRKRDKDTTMMRRFAVERGRVSGASSDRFVSTSATNYGTRRIAPSFSHNDSTLEQFSICSSSQNERN